MSSQIVCKIRQKTLRPVLRLTTCSKLSVSCDHILFSLLCSQTDEDCLYLNVWIPRRILTKVQSDKVLDREHYVVAPEYQKGGKSLPVMVWFYGGAFSSGAGSCTLYEGRYLAHEGDVVVVTTNYRCEFCYSIFFRWKHCVVLGDRNGLILPFCILQPQYCGPSQPPTPLYILCIGLFGTYHCTTQWC